MKKIYGLVLGLLFYAGSYAQTVTLTSDTLQITSPGGTGIINFGSTPLNAVTPGVLTIYTKGDFSDVTEYVDIIDERGNNLGQASSDNDCETNFDPTVINITQYNLNTLNADNNITFNIDASISVSSPCSPYAEIYATLTYDTCTGGTPVTVNFTASTYSTCADQDAIALTPNIVGGTFIGAGIVGDEFFPNLTGRGTYPITYSYLDNTVGCTTTFDTNLVVRNSLVAMDTTICINTSTTLTTNGTGDNYIWYDNTTTQIDTGSQLTTGSLNATTSYFVSKAIASSWYIDTIYTTGITVDHLSYTSDDRGGIAVNQNYVYINGDANIVRYDLDMTNPISLPKNDGIFSDLTSGQIYALYNTTTDTYPQGSSITNYSVNSIVSLDDMLNPIDTIELSQSFWVSGNYANTNQAGIYAGAGYVIVYTGTSNTTFYKIDLPSGNVANLGTYLFSTKQANENWSSWGFSDSTGGDFSVIYRRNSTQKIERLNLTTHTSSTIQTFTTLSDMASITYSPWNKRIYFHNESGNQWGGGSEMGGYIDANHTANGNLVAYGSCLAESVVTVDECLSLDELTTQLEVNVYPNPSEGLFTVQLSNNSTNVKAIVFDVYGKIVYNQKLDSHTENQVNLTHLSKGIYFIQLIKDKNNITKRLFIK